MTIRISRRILAIGGGSGGVAAGTWVRAMARPRLGRALTLALALALALVLALALALAIPLCAYPLTRLPPYPTYMRTPLPC